MEFTFQGEHFTLEGTSQHEIFPLLSHTQVKRALRKDNKAYMVYVNEVDKGSQPSLSPPQHEFLKSFHDCLIY